MLYKQTVNIKDRNIEKVIDSFHRIDFIKFLISFQPVKIIKWHGIENNLSAHLKFWLFKWHSFIVIHKNYKRTDNSLSFVDKGITLPLGITEWDHLHKVEYLNNEIVISDSIEFKHRFYIFEFMLYPILISPIIIRKFLYKIYFKKN
tara:strand:- start:1402 stop:1842 length:441 start_codon:yes stop_codon:yes gene_type:complete